ncbi:MAG: hypothetical protein LBU85_04255, partial [Treponema sp.]|nr:hypothetical protein [Treponema sp.]
MYKCLIVFVVLACLANCSGKKPSYTTNSDEIKKETVADNSATDNIQQDYSVEEENINWRKETLEYYYKGYIPDEKNLILTNLYDVIRNEIHQKQPNEGTIYNGINELENSLVDFFYTEKNWNVDVGKELPFILVEKASDDRFRFYHWAYESPTGHAYKGILQYR